MPTFDATVLMERLEAQLGLEAQEALRKAWTLCETLGLGIYLVGGAVRDLVLDRPTLDLDLALVGEVAPVAQSLASLTGGKAVLHSRFGTASVAGNGFHLDLARTRRETYAHPGALPQVEPATLADDLSRRDFTVNAMALQLEPPLLIDPYEGVRDIELKLIRVLHQNSFRDDATRALRAVRYASRLGFSVENQTASWLRRDLGYVEPVSGPRLRRELRLLFEEHETVYGAMLAKRLGLLEAIHPSFALSDDVGLRWRDALDGSHFAERDELGFCVLAGEADEVRAMSVSKRLNLEGRFQAALQDTVRLRTLWAKLATLRGDPAEAVETLEPYQPAAVWATSVLAGGDTSWTCIQYLEVWRHVRPQLNGDELMSLGVPSGTTVGDTLRSLRRARLAGLAPTREAEAALVFEMLGKQRE